VVLWNQASISNGFRDIQWPNGELDAMVDTTLNDLYAKVRSFILVSIDSSLPLPVGCQSVNSNFCARTHRLATIHTSQTDRQKTDGRKAVS